MTRNIGAELAARMKQLNEMLANGESVGAISRVSVDRPQAIEMPHMMSVAREWLAAENQRMAQAGETDYCGSAAHIVGWLLAEVQRLRLVVCDRISELGEEMERTPQPHATPGEGTRRGVCTRAAYEGDIEDRLRNWHGLHLAHFGERAEEAAAEIARLREAIRRLADQDATLSACNGNVTVTMDTPLTDAEREAVAWFANYGYSPDGVPGRMASTLRGLLERTK